MEKEKTEHIMPHVRKQPKAQGLTKLEKDVASLFPDHSASEISKTVGCCLSTIRNISRKLGLKHSDETTRRINENRLANLRKAYTKDIIRKRMETRKRTRRMETFRVLSGEPQRTKIKIRRIPRKSYAAKYHLIHEYGYFRYEDDLFVIGFDKNTRRTNEVYFSKKYGFNFEEDTSCQED